MGSTKNFTIANLHIDTENPFTCMSEGVIYKKKAAAKIRGCFAA